MYQFARNGNVVYVLSRRHRNTCDTIAPCVYNLSQKTVAFNKVELFIDVALFLSAFLTCCYRIFHLEPALNRYKVQLVHISYKIYITVYCKGFRLARSLGNDKKVMISFESFIKKNEVDSKCCERYIFFFHQFK